MKKSLSTGILSAAKDLAPSLLSEGGPEILRCAQDDISRRDGHGIRREDKAVDILSSYVCLPDQLRHTQMGYRLPSIPLISQLKPSIII